MAAKDSELAHQLLVNHWGLDLESKEEAGLQLVSDLIKITTGADDGFVGIINEESEEVVLVMSAESRHEGVRGQVLPMANSLIGLAIASEEVVFGAEQIDWITDTPRQLNLLVSPILLDGDCIGVLLATSEAAFSLSSERTAFELANLAGIVVHFSRIAGDKVAQGAAGELTEAEHLRSEIANELSGLMNARPDQLLEIKELLRGITRFISTTS